MTKSKIVTSHVYPPIPVRTSDWCAYREGEEERGGYGWGATEEEAIAAFLEQEEDALDAPPVTDEQLRAAGYTSAAREYPLSRDAAQSLADYCGVSLDQMPAAWWYSPNAHVHARREAAGAELKKRRV